GAALAGRARDADLPAEEPRELARDREPEPRAAVLAARGAVGLLEGLEDQALLVRRDADAGVHDCQGHDLPGMLEDRMARGPAARCLGDAQRYAAAARELEGVGEQVGDDLLQPLAVGLHCRG